MGKLGKAFKRLGWARKVRRSRRDAGCPSSSRLGRFHGFESLEDRRLLSATSYEPTHCYATGAEDSLAAAMSGEPLDIALEYLTTNAAAYGLEAADVANNLVVTDQYTDEDTGVTHIYLEETFHDLEVVNTSLAINIAADGSVLSVGGDTVAGLASLEQTAAATAPSITAVKALQNVAAALGLGQTEATQQLSVSGTGQTRRYTFADADLSENSITTSLHYVATADGMRLAWSAEVQPSAAVAYDMSIDATTGEVLRQVDLVEEFDAGGTATYRVFAMPTESPDDTAVSPDPWVSTTVWGTRDENNVPTTTDASDPSAKTASPYGWHDTDGLDDGADTTTTSGNNCVTDPVATGSTVTTNDPSLTFSYPLNLTLAPSRYTAASVTNAFYWVNLLHDIHYVYGFNEAAGNFQSRNYTGAGTAGDEVNVLVQYDGGGDDPLYNNAYFTITADGTSGTMGLFLWTRTSPMRDSALESQIIIHEYGHGVSTRLVGGPSNAQALSGLQSGAIGEGFSDLWALLFTQKSGDAATDSYAIGNYLSGETSSGAGIRRYAYSTDMNVDPLTYGSYNISSEVHDAGEIWCSTLWDLNWLLIDKYGYNSEIGTGYSGEGDAGNQLMLQLAMDSLKLMPANPTMLDARDALLMADQVRTGGENQQEIWQAFANRGMGLYAYDGGSADSLTVVEDFTCPSQDAFVTTTTPSADVPTLSHADFTFSEKMNINSFSIADDVVSFTDPAGVDLKSTLAAQMSYTWLDNTTLRVSFPQQTSAGVYTLTIGPQILSADNGHAMDQDLDGTPGESPSDAVAVSVSVVPDTFGYQVVSTAYQDISLRNDASATTVSLSNRDSGYGTITLAADTFRFYGTEYSTLYVYANGLITLGGIDANDTDVNGDLRSSPEYPTLAVYWDDLYSTGAGRIAYKVEGDQLVIEWSGMAPYGYQAVSGDNMTFQAILGLNSGANSGDIIFNYVDLVAGSKITSDGFSATVGIKDLDLAGTHRVLLAQNEKSSPYVSSGEAVKIVAGGSIAGRVFKDSDADGVQDTNEGGVAGWQVYLDLNQNGSYDAGDTLTTTDSAGNYVFEYLSWGDYVVRQIQRAGWQATTVSSYTVSLRSSEDVSGSVFGELYTNTAPVIADQSFPAAGGTLYENSAAGTVVGTIVATDAQTLTYAVVSGNEAGAFAVNSATGVITVADASKLDFETTPTFNLVVRVTDSVTPALSSSANVAIRLTNVNEAPAVTGDAYFAASDTPLVVNAAAGVLINDKDPEGTALTATLVTAPAHGTVTLAADGSFTYEPAAGYTGPDQFTYKATDTSGLSTQGTVTFTIGAAVTLKLPADIWESRGNYEGQGSVSIPKALGYNLVVTLTTTDSDASELSVPASVTIYAGQTSATFDVTARDETAEDGSQTITVTASASGFYSDAANVVVRDDDVSYFTLATLTSPQTAGIPFEVDVTARDALGATIEIYSGTVFFSATNVSGASISGLTWSVYTAAGAATNEQAFVNGTAAFLVTIPSLQSGVQLVASDAQDTSGHEGRSNRFNVSYGAVSTFAIDPIATTQWVSSATDMNPIPLVVTALDANGFTVANYAKDTEVTAWVARDGAASTVVISEVGDGSPDYVEIQNVTASDVDTSGWMMVVNDPTNGDATAVLSTRWYLSDVMAAGSVDYRSDDAADATHYYGENLPWGAGTAKGWVMLVDKTFQVRDFVAWGYDAYTIKALVVDLGVTSVRVYDSTDPDASEWNGAAVAYGGTSTLSLQRTANRDGNAAADFAWLTSSFQQKNASLAIPFDTPVRPVSMATNTISGFANGTYVGGVYITETVSDVFLRVSDRAGHIAESNTFNVATAVAPVLASTPGMYDSTSSNFFLRSSNSPGVSNISFGYGPAGAAWLAVAGDWDGDGVDTVGLYDPVDSVFYLTNTTNGQATTMFGFGAPAAGWTPIAGDWNGDGRDTVGLYDALAATFYLTDSNSSGTATRMLVFGPLKNGWTPIAGNWDGLAGDGIGLYSPSDSVFYLKNDASAATAATADTSFGFGAAHWTPIAGDWDGDRVDTIGLVDPTTSNFYLRNTNSAGYADMAFGYGAVASGWIPVVGDWTGASTLTAAAPSLSPADAVRVDAAQLPPLVTAALEQWSGLGVSAAVMERLKQVEYVVVDLPGNELGRAEGQTIYLDTDAAGWGWFIDATPGDDEEFAAGTALAAEAVDHVDLLTVVAHELGHVAGQEHALDAEALMAATLPAGARRTAGLAELDALFADGFDEV
jgi:hypothetical protein